MDDLRSVTWQPSWACVCGLCLRPSIASLTERARAGLSLVPVMPIFGGGMATFSYPEGLRHGSAPGVLLTLCVCFFSDPTGLGNQTDQSADREIDILPIDCNRDLIRPISSALYHVHHDRSFSHASMIPSRT